VSIPQATYEGEPSGLAGSSQQQPMVSVHSSFYF